VAAVPYHSNHTAHLLIAVACWISAGRCFKALLSYCVVYVFRRGTGLHFLAGEPGWRQVASLAPTSTRCPPVVCSVSWTGAISNIFGKVSFKSSRACGVRRSRPAAWFWSARPVRHARSPAAPAEPHQLLHRRSAHQLSPQAPRHACQADALPTGTPAPAARIPDFVCRAGRYVPLYLH
jgi:hypothetical protein